MKFSIADNIITSDLDILLQDVIRQLHNGTILPVNKSEKSLSSNNNSFGKNVLAKAIADLGVREDLGKNDGKRIREYFKYFDMDGGQDWCAAAVSAWMKEAGGGPIAGAVGARNVGKQFAQAGKWVSRENITSKDMSPGNIVVWSRGGPDSWKGHIGVIDTFDGRNSFTSIEGNSGSKSDSVVRNSHTVSDSNLLGIGILSDITYEINNIKQSSNNIVNSVIELSDLFLKKCIL